MLVRKHRILFLIFAFMPLFFNAQTEAEMKVQADKLFTAEQYLEATPLYLRLLSLQPRNFDYNYRYGTCLLYNSNRKQEAIKYLSSSVNDPNAVPEAYYFLGKALHLNYQFNEAIKQYSIYLEKRPTEGKVYDAERDIQMCQNGKRLMTTISDIIVLDKKELTSDKFFRVYELNDIGGNLLVTAEFQTKLDKKNNHIPLIHFPQNPSVIYYSSYGENLNSGKDIYVRRKLPDGSWGMPQKIPGNVNTQFDEDFPYMHPDGNYLYFSSKGHNSMGGYDVFRSKYDPENNSFGPPENMDFAISSPDDDLFYVVDSLNQDAYFASARQSEIGKLYVYKVKVDRVPIQLAVIKGNFVSEIDPSIKKINFEIKDYATGESVGKFNSNEKAVYLLTFPKGGKYEYIMTIDGVEKEFRSIVSIPFMKEFKPLKQKIVHANEDGREIVKIINLFNEEVDDPQAVIAEVIKMRSTLDVNVNEFNLEEIEAEKANKEILSELGMGELLLTEMTDVLKDQVKKGSENKELLKTIGNNINTLIVENSADYIRLEEQIKTKVAEANKSLDTDGKYILLKEAEAMIKKQEELKKYSKDLLRLNDSVKGVLANSTSTADEQKMKSISTQFDNLYREGKEKEALQVIAANKDFIVKVMNDNSGDLVQNLVDKVVKYDDEISTQKAKVDGYNRELNDLEIEISSLQNSIYSAKKKDVPAIEAKIAQKKEEIILIQEERNVVQKSIDQKSLEKYQINKQIQILQDAISNKSIANVSKEEATKALSETERTNANTLTAYVNQQITQLEKDDPSLKDRIVVSSGLKAQNIFEEFKASAKGIEDDPKLSKEDRLYKLLANERSAIRLLDKRLEEIDNLLAENKFDENLNREKQQLLTYKNEIKGQIAQHEKQVEALVAKDGVGDPETVITSIQPNYNENINFIASNTNLSPQEKTEALNKEDNKLLTAVESELKKLDSQLINSPNDKTLQLKQNTLNKIKEETESAIEKRNSELNTETNIVKAPTENELIDQLDPSYVESKEKINSNANLSPVEKLKALNKEDQQLIAAIDKELVNVNAQLAKKPNDKSLLAKKEILTKLKSDKAAAIEQRNSEISTSSEVASAPTKIELIKQLDPTYEEKKTEILENSQLTKTEKLKALNSNDEQLLSSVESELERINDQLAKSPNDKILLVKKEKLIELEKELESEIGTRVTELNAEQPIASNKSSEKVIGQLDPEYASKIDQIQSDKSISKVQQLENLNIADQELIEKVDSQLTKIENQLEDDPSNKELQAEKEILTGIKEDKLSQIANREKEIKASESVDLVNNESTKLIEELEPGYAKEVEKINKNETLSADEKMTQLQLKDKELVSAIDTKIASLEKQLMKDAENKTLLEEKEKFTELRAVTESKMEEREQLIDSKLANELTAENRIEQQGILRNKIDPGYEKKIDAARKKEGSDLEKKNAELKVEQQFLDKVIAEENITKKILSKDPFNKEAKTKLFVLTDLKKEAETNITNLNSDITALKNGQPLVLITEQDKIDKINTLAPAYSSIVESINAADVSSKEKAEQLLDEEKQLLAAIIENKKAVQEQLKSDPANRALQKELKVLEELEKETEARILEHEKVINSVERIPEVTEAEKNEMIKSLSPNYVETLQSIENNSDLNTNDKLQQTQTEDQKLLGTVYDRLEKIEEELNSDPSSVDLKKEQNVLNAISVELEKQIEIRQAKINSSEINTVSTVDKQKMIDQLHPTYSDYVAIIEKLAESESDKLNKLQNEDRNLLSKVISALEKNEEALTTNPNDQKSLKEKQVLEALQIQIQDAIADRERKINGETTDTSVSEVEKTEMIDRIDPEYLKEKAQLENDNSISSKEKTEQLLALENVFLDKVNTEKVATKEKLNEDPSNLDVKKELAVLDEIQKESEARVSEQKELVQNQSTPIVSQEDQGRMIATIFPDYETRKENVLNSPLPENKKVDERIKLENELLTKLQTEEKNLRKALAKDPENTDLKQKVAVVEELLKNQKTVLANLNEQNIQLDAKAKEAELLASTDKSYVTDIEKLKSTETSTKNSDLAEREVIHQERLNTKIEANEKVLEKKDNPTLKAENELLKKEFVESKNREENYRNGGEPTQVNEEQKEAFVSTLREDLLQGKTNALTDENSTVETLKSQDQILEQYERELVTQIEKQEEIVANAPENTDAKKELEWLKEELNTVQAKRRKVKITIGELEKITVIQENTIENRFNDPELQKLDQKEASLEQQLSDPSLSSKEKQAIQKELALVQKESAVKESNLLTTEIGHQKEESKELESALKASATTDEEAQLNARTALAQQKELDAQSEALVKEANSTKNIEEKNYLLNEALNKEEKANAIAIEALVENELQKLEKENGITSLETSAELEKKKRRYSIQIGELTKLITMLDDDIENAKGKEAEILKKQRTDKIEERALIQKQLDTVNEQLGQVKEIEFTLKPESMDQVVSYNEEQNIAATDVYRNYEEKATAALAVEKQIINLEAQLIEEKATTKRLVAESLDNSSDENKMKVQENVLRVKEMESELQILKTELTTKQTLANEALPTNTEEAMKMQNLVKRGIKPIQKMAIVAALVPLPANGLEINSNGTNTYSAAKPIPVDVKNPTGLVYRVQVGAFAKPIPQDLFKEFNPVSGEKLNNSNIVRYMAGFFNNSAKVVEARDQIKALGYADAFAVAYCDGKRITLAEARVLEANGECLAKGENELMLEVATNTAVKMGIIDSTGLISANVSLPKVEEYTYNQAVGAVKAEPVEKHLGLFYTVQVGVFNKPVSSKTVYNIEPLITQRLPNGQIRYSTGMFNSIDEARPKKSEAVEKGIKDAFITAYYNGERITLIEAQRILDEKGPSILENNIIKKAQSQSSTAEVSPENTITESTEEIVAEVKKERIQIVTKKTFYEFPREILNRYNSHGSFYYDETDKKVKSSIAESKDELPQVFYFKDDVDTVYLSESVMGNTSIISVNFVGTALPGDFIDWLLRYNYRREFKQTDAQIELKIFGVTEEKLPELEGKLEQFGLQFTKEKE